MSEALILLFVLGFWFAALTVVAVVVRLRQGARKAADVEREELDARWARGEITAGEYARRRQALGGTTVTDDAGMVRR